MKAKHISVQVTGISPDTEGWLVLEDGRKLKLKDLSGHVTVILKRATELPAWVSGHLEFKRDA